MTFGINKMIEFFNKEYEDNLKKQIKREWELG